MDRAKTNEHLERKLAKLKSDLEVSDRELRRLREQNLEAITEAARTIQQSHEEVLRRMDAILAKNSGSDANG